MNELKIFQNPEFGTVRTIEIEGKIHFAGIDVAKALGYSIPSKAIQTHCRNILKWKVGVKPELSQMEQTLFNEWKCFLYRKVIYID